MLDFLSGNQAELSISEVKTTEEIEKAADFSQSSNESILKLASGNSVENVSRRGTPVPVEDLNTAKVTVTSDGQYSGNGGGNGNAVHKIEIRMNGAEVVKNEEQVRDGNNREILQSSEKASIKGQLDEVPQTRVKSVAKSELGYDPRRHISKRCEANYQTQRWVIIINIL
jgi:hypothetical protein